MNSIIQSLSNTKPLLEYCLSENYELDKNTTTSKLKGALIIGKISNALKFVDVLLH